MFCDNFLFLKILRKKCFSLKIFWENCFGKFFWVLLSKIILQFFENYLEIAVFEIFGFLKFFWEYFFRKFSDWIRFLKFFYGFYSENCFTFLKIICQFFWNFFRKLVFWKIFSNFFKDFFTIYKIFLELLWISSTVFLLKIILLFFSKIVLWKLFCDNFLFLKILRKMRFLNFFEKTFLGNFLNFSFADHFTIFRKIIW